MHNIGKNTFLLLLCLLLAATLIINPWVSANTTPLHYVIMTTQKMANSSLQLPHFIAAKKRQGFCVEIVTEASWGGGSGDTAANNIRAWLARHYRQKNIKYVLFIGNPDPDHGTVPMKRCFPHFDEALTDHYYADLTGNWDLDGDGKYGEQDDFGPGGIDAIPDVIVGRIPCYDRIHDTDQILAKIIKYQNADPATSAWRKNALVYSMDPDPHTPTERFGKHVVEKALAPNGWNHTLLHNTQIEDTMAAWTKRPVGLCIWFAHGSTHSASGVINCRETYRLDDDHPCFTFQSSCHNAYPKRNDNLAYVLLRHGAVSTVAATTKSFYKWRMKDFPGTASAPGLPFSYAKRLIDQRMPAGDSLLDCKLNMPAHRGYDFLWWHSYDYWQNHLVYNLYGDPSLGIYPTHKNHQGPSGDKSSVLPVHDTPCIAANTPRETTPPTGGISIAEGALVISRSVTLRLPAFGGKENSVISAMRLKNEDTFWLSWEPYQPEKSWFLSAGPDSRKKVSVQFQDSVGNMSSVYSTTVDFADTEAPRGLLTINSTNRATNHNQVTLWLQPEDNDGSGVKEMCFSLEGRSYTPWEPFVHSKTWRFPEGDGTKTIYVRFKDYFGNESTPIKKEILLDSTPPVGRVWITRIEDIPSCPHRTINLFPPSKLLNSPDYVLGEF